MPLTEGQGLPWMGLSGWSVPGSREEGALERGPGRPGCLCQHRAGTACARRREDRHGHRVWRRLRADSGAEKSDPEEQVAGASGPEACAGSRGPSP